MDGRMLSECILCTVSSALLLIVSHPIISNAL